MCRPKGIGVLCSILLLTVTGLAAASPTIERVTLFSQILGEDRPLNIALPADYSPESTYPVVYALDGDADYIPVLAERMQAAHERNLVQHRS